MKRTTRFLILAACMLTTACTTIAGLQDVPTQNTGAANDGAVSPDAGADGGNAACTTPCVLGASTVGNCCLQ